MTFHSRLTASAALAAVGLGFLGTTVQAKTPGHEYCFNGVCHRVKTLEETQRLVGVPTQLKASYYDAAGHDAYNPSNQTSSGEYFHPERPDNAASPIYPDGTKLLVWHPASGKALVIRVNNAGPYWGDRKLDLSRAAAERFGFIGRGVAALHVRVLEAPSKAEATYRKGRTYPPVKGYLGQFASLDAAATSVVEPAPTRLALAAPLGVAPEPPIPQPPAAKPVLAALAAAQPATEPRASRSATSKSSIPTVLELKIAKLVDEEARKYIVAQQSFGLSDTVLE